MHSTKRFSDVKLKNLKRYYYGNHYNSTNPNWFVVSPIELTLTNTYNNRAVISFVNSYPLNGVPWGIEDGYYKFPIEL